MILNNREIISTTKFFNIKLMLLAVLHRDGDVSDAFDIHTIPDYSINEVD